jgi:Holliday junction resolvase RusA-like endonuclease
MILTLPIPPSTNALYANSRAKGRKGRRKTTKYLAWIEQADKYYMMQKRSVMNENVSGRVALTFRIAHDEKVDASNILKAGEDYLVSRRITPDDRHNWSVTAERSARIPVGMCEVEIREVEGAE